MSSIAEVYERVWTAPSEYERQSSFNKNKFKDEGIAELTVKKEDVAYKNSSYTYPVWTIDIDKAPCKLSKPLALKVTKEELRYYAESNILDICGYGDTPQDAIADALGDIAYFYSHYAALSEDKVVGYGKYLKEKYNNLLST